MKLTSFSKVLRRLTINFVFPSKSSVIASINSSNDILTAMRKYNKARKIFKNDPDVALALVSKLDLKKNPLSSV